MSKYSVTVVKDKATGMYDCRLWRDGTLFQAFSGTLFNYADQARDYGKDLIAQIKAADAKRTPTFK